MAPKWCPCHQSECQYVFPNWYDLTNQVICLRVKSIQAPVRSDFWLPVQAQISSFSKYLLPVLYAEAESNCLKLPQVFHALLQGIFPTQGLRPGLPHCRQTLLLAEPQEKPKNTGVGSLSLLPRIFLAQESNWGLLHCRWILYQLSYQTCPGLHVLTYTPPSLLHFFFLYAHRWPTLLVF